MWVADDPAGCPFEMAAVRLGHVGGIGRVAPRLMAPQVARDPPAPEEDLDGRGREADVGPLPHDGVALHPRQPRDEAQGRRVVRPQARSFADLLEQSLRRYQNRAIETAQVIEELIALAEDMRARGVGEAAARVLSSRSQAHNECRAQWRLPES